MMVLVALMCVGVSLYLIPDPSGYNTHTQLGLPPCPRYAQTGWPCLTCGMTTAFAYAARLRFDRAFLCQPFGTLLFISILGGGVGALYCLIRRRSILQWLGSVHPLKYFALGGIVFLLLVASWAFKARKPIADWYSVHHASKKITTSNKY